MLTTCPSALKMLLAKTSLSNYEVERDDDENYNNIQVGQQPQTSSSTVAFNTDFVKYYYGKLHENLLKIKKNNLQIVFV